MSQSLLYPVLKTILKYAGAPYLIYLAVAIAMSGATTTARDNAVRKFAAADPGLAGQGARLQYRDGVVAADLALSSVHGRMMPHRAMREKGFPWREKWTRQRRKFAGDRRSHLTQMPD